jgi:hypothetical protein
MTEETEEVASDAMPMRQPTRIELNDAANFIESMIKLGATEVSVGVVFVRVPQRRPDFVPYGKAG